MVEEVVKTPTKQVREIEAQKILLESRARKRFEKIFRNMSKDISSILATGKAINPKEVADNYRPDFVAALRETYRETIKRFGFSLREEAEKKFDLDLNLEIERKRVDHFCLKQDDIEIDERASELLNQEMFSEITFFVNNQSETQADLITETNTKEIDTTVKDSFAAFALLLSTNLRKRQDADERLRDLNLERALPVDRSVAEIDNDIRATERQLNVLAREEDRLNTNKNKIISDQFSDDFLDKGTVRSETISEFEVGQTESFIRNREASLVNSIVLAGTGRTMLKNWDATLDRKTRKAHVAADARYRFNPIPVDQRFVVGGELLRFPRDPSGSPGNIINCRCVSTFSIE